MCLFRPKRHRCVRCMQCWGENRRHEYTRYFHLFTNKYFPLSAPIVSRKIKRYQFYASLQPDTRLIFPVAHTRRKNDVLGKVRQFHIRSRISRTCSGSYRDPTEQKQKRKEGRRTKKTSARRKEFVPQHEVGCLGTMYAKVRARNMETSVVEQATEPRCAAFPWRSRVGPYANQGAQLFSEFLIDPLILFFYERQRDLQISATSAERHRLLLLLLKVVGNSRLGEWVNEVNEPSAIWTHIAPGGTVPSASLGRFSVASTSSMLLMRTDVGKTRKAPWKTLYREISTNKALRKFLKKGSSIEWNQALLWVELNVPLTVNTE